MPLDISSFLKWLRSMMESGTPYDPDEKRNVKEVESFVVKQALYNLRSAAIKAELPPSQTFKVSRRVNSVIYIGDDTWLFNPDIVYPMNTNVLAKVMTAEIRKYNTTKEALAEGQ